MLVYQVQAVDSRGNVRIVHAYVTVDEAEEAIDTMQPYARCTYQIIQCTNDASQFWGIEENS